MYTSQELEKMVASLIKGPKEIEQMTTEGTQLEDNYHAAVERNSIGGVVDMSGFIELTKYVTDLTKQKQKIEAKQKELDDYEQRIIAYFVLMPGVKLSYRIWVGEGGRQRYEDYIISLSDDKKKLIIENR